jgi:sugar phosphate permease
LRHNYHCFSKNACATILKEIRRRIKALKKKHWKLVILSGILYFFCQICRTDLSACMVDLLPDLGIAKDAMGLAITAGYIAYAVGMSINSLLTDRTNPRLMICATMFCCAATHLGIRLLPYLPVMLVLWCVNGYAQSAVWPSIVRLTADNLPAEQQESALRIVSLFQHAGSLSCFLIVPAELALGGWRTAMSVTAAACLTLGFVWFLMRDLRTASQTTQMQKKRAAKLNWQFFRRGKLLYFMGAACLTGMIRDGLTSWAPVYFSEEFSLNATLSLILSAVLPAAKILALAVHPAVQKKVPKTRTQLIVFYVGCAAAACIVLLANFAGWTLAAAGFMAVMLCLMVCTDLSFTISIPIQFGSIGRSATVSGILDCMLYLGAAISSYLFALLAQWGGWTATIVSWIVIPLIAIGILLSRKNLEPETAEKD